MYQKPNIIIIDDQTQTASARSHLAPQLNIFFAETPSKGLQISHNKNVDVIILDFSVNETSSLGLSFLFKESELTRDIPILILSDNMQLQQHISDLEFCGIQYLSKSCPDQVLVSTINRLSSDYKRAIAFQDNEKAVIKKQEFLIKLPSQQLKKVISSDFNCGYMLVALDRQRLGVNFSDLTKEETEACSSFLENILATFFAKDNENLVQIENIVRLKALQYLSIQPFSEHSKLLQIAEQIEEAFIFGSSGKLPFLVLEPGSLNIGITTIQSVLERSSGSILETVEEALSLAQENKTYFFII